MQKLSVGGSSATPQHPSSAPGGHVIARPQKAPQDRATEQLNIRLTPRELVEVQAKAQSAATNMTAFARAAILNKRVVVEQSTAPEFITRHELRRIGLSLNQIARSMNAFRPHDTTELAALCGKLDTLFDKWLNDGPQDRQCGP